MSFSQEILAWYSIYKRSLPWRETKDPYKIWLSEIILQQTKVVQGTPYYFSFVNTFPTVFHLANAPEEHVLKLWQGLGYYSRARNLHSAAKQVVSLYNGVFPKDYSSLLTLKGVGDYTASAIAAICYNAPEAVLDGNVYRVLARHFGIEVPINTSFGAKTFKALAIEQLPLQHFGDYNQGIMEFGALQCVPKSPNCSGCPLQQSCVAYATKRVSMLPLKLPKAKPLKVYFNYLVFIDPQQHTLYNKRVGKGIWEGLYEFPLLETTTPIPSLEMALPITDSLQSGLFKTATSVYPYNKKPIVHKLTHRHIIAHFWIVKTAGKIIDGTPLAHVEKHPTSVLISDFIKAFKNSYF